MSVEEIYKVLTQNTLLHIQSYADQKLCTGQDSCIIGGILNLSTGQVEQLHKTCG